MAKFIFVVGGVYSGTGKGVASASIGFLLKERNLKVQMLKLDPYLNVNAGIIRPSDHGEVYVCDDGSEIDLDAGTYYRIANEETSKDSICTSGTLYKELIFDQENGKYLGQTLQITPHMTEKITSKLLNVEKDNDVVIVEIGGTVGDSESFAFFETIRQFKQNKDCMIIMVAPIIWADTIKEFKTKPLQNSVKELQKCGLFPDILLCRSNFKLPNSILEKTSSMTGIPLEMVFSCPDVSSLYDVPIEFYNLHIDDIIVDRFRLKRNVCKIHSYKELIDKSKKFEKHTNIAVVCKYDNSEAYLSLKEAIHHAAIHNDCKANIYFINSDFFENKNQLQELNKYNAVIVPGGFDYRGVEGKINAIKYCRENKIPFLGICLGLQCAVIEFARNICGIKDANSLEFEKDCKNPVINYVLGQKDIQQMSGTMRLGAYNCKLQTNSLANISYNNTLISERHRHRYEVNSEYKPILEKNGFIVSGVNPETGLIEIMELDTKIHPFFIGIQAHPEFKSRLLNPSPLFVSLIKESLKR